MTEQNEYTDLPDLGGDVLEATKDILFLGTPHRGSDLGWTGFVTYALSPVGVRADLIVELRSNYHKLTQSTENFFEYVRACRDSKKPVQFRSFYETRKLIVCIVG
jgi:hypothetical protein